MDNFKESMYIGPMIYFGTYPIPFTGTLPDSLKAFQGISYPNMMPNVLEPAPRLLPSIGNFPEDFEQELIPDN